MSKHLRREYKSRQRRGDGKVCPKTSFDRLGDDLTELILSFLPLEDKFRFECLNRRIQSLIYNKENRLELDFISKHVIGEYFNTLNEVLKKLKAINSIEINFCWPEINGQLLITIADHCKHLTSLHTYSGLFGREFDNEEAIEYFRQTLGHKLKNLSVSESTPEAAEKLLKLTPNLKSLKIESYLMDILWSEKERLLPKLKDITIVNCRAKELNQFHRYYGQNIRSLRICLHVYETEDGLIEEEPLQVLKQLSKFNRLTDLHLEIIRPLIPDLLNNEIFCNSMRNMFKGMTNLKRLFFNNNLNDFDIIGLDKDSHRVVKLLFESKQLMTTDVLIRLTFAEPLSWIRKQDIIKERLVKDMKDNELDNYLVFMKLSGNGDYRNGFKMNIKFRKNCD